LRILQVHTHYRQPGGEDAVVATEARLLRASGHDVLTWQESNPQGTGAAVSLAAAAWNPAAARRLRRTAERFRPDVAHVHNTWFAMSPAAITTLHELAIPVVMTLHNYRLICAAATLYRDGAPCRDCVGTHPWHAVAHRCYRDSTIQSAVAAATTAVHARRGTWHAEVDRFLALSRFGRDQFVAGGLPAHKIIVKPNSVGDPGVRAQPPSSSRTVLFVGRLSEEKGVDDLLRAWSHLSSDLELVIVGTGPLEAKLRRGAPPGVTFTGRQQPEAVAALMLSARALVFPSTWYEGQPLTILEAAAAGLPVVLSDLGAMSEVFAPDAQQLLFRAGDQTHLLERLGQLRDDEFVDSHGNLTREHFERRYTHELALRHLETVYGAVSGC
jgi:glycosyltransferase involved in cell wall biosynthesis